jgi:predicted SAM-dependent methyltransferase
MKLVTTPSGHRLLLVWRTELLFYRPERRRLADEWNHVRLTSAPLSEWPNLINHSLNRPLPFADESFDAIYSFHVIEHLSPRVKEGFIGDVHRLLKPGGICRVSTPDLEFHAGEYLQCLREQLASPSVKSYANYRWAVCNLIDQCAREVCGGEMWKIICDREYTTEYVKYMNGDLLDFLFQPAAAVPPRSAAQRPRSTAQRLVRAIKNPMLVAEKLGRPIRRWLRRDTPQKSFFELSHERNLWLFDRVSLGRLLSGAGFQNIAVTDHLTSRIPGWNRYNFDQSAYGEYPVEPSLYMEGTKRS